MSCEKGQSPGTGSILDTFPSRGHPTLPNNVDLYHLAAVLMQSIILIAPPLGMF